MTSEYYIGSASTGNIYSRFTSHLLSLNGSKLVKIAVKKYDLSNFAFLLIDRILEKVNKENNKMLFQLENFYLQSLLPSYNILTKAGGTFCYNYPKSTKLKMKASCNLERQLKIAKLIKGKNINSKIIKNTINTRQKAYLKSRNKLIISEQVQLNMKKKSKPIILYNLDKTVFGKYDSIAKAAKFVNCSVKTIYKALKSENKILKKKYIVKLKI